VLDAQMNSYFIAISYLLPRDTMMFVLLSLIRHDINPAWNVHAQQHADDHTAR
jgi:hypothetical protein